jgi:hypothetical protein
MKNQKKRVCGHFFLLCVCVAIFGCGAEDSAPGSEPLRGILGNGGNLETGREADQEYTDDGVPIITTDQEEEERQRTQASHTANGELTCTGIFDCFNGCVDDDQACVESCTNEGSEQARAQVDAIAICMQDNQCAHNACVETSCASALNACGFGETSDDGETPSSSNELDCNGVYTCFGECGEGDRACLDDCFGQGSSAAQSQVNAVGQCAQDNQCQDGECVDANCPTQVAACNGASTSNGNTGGSASSNGNLNCADIFECYGQCARGDQGCLDGCERSGTAAAQSQVDAIGSCIDRNQCEDSGCVDRMCATEVNNCSDEQSSAGNSPGNPNPPSDPNLGGGSGGSSGTQSCTDVFECFGTCSEGDRACLDSCYEQGTAAAQSAVSNVGSCVQTNQCQDDDCVNRMCPQEVAECEGQSAGSGSGGGGVQPPTPPSNLSCTDVYLCFRECTSQDQACRQACFDRGSISSQGQVNAIGTCVQNNQCEDDECVETECYNELVQCGFEVDPPETDSTYVDPLDRPQGSDDESGAEDFNLPASSDADGMCGAAYPLTWGTQTGATAGGATNHRGSCSGDGAEAVFEFTVDSDTMICLDTFDSSFDTALYVRADDCGAQSAEVACDDDTYGVQSQVHFSAQAGVTYYVFVDSYNVSGNFNLTATRGDCRDRFGF